MLTQSPQKVIGARALENKNIAYTTLYVDWDDIVRLFHLLELRMNESLIEIKD